MALQRHEGRLARLPSNKGMGHGKAEFRRRRQFERIWDNATTDAPSEQPRSDADQAKPADEKPEPDPEVADALSAVAWASLEIKPDERLLGDVITSSTRTFLVGPTGIGKTIFIYGMVGGMASGLGFLHWTCDRPSKWLIIDGEMPSSLIKSRTLDMLRRAGGDAIPPHNILIYSRDREDVFAKQFSRLGKISPLNTEAGHHFVMDLVAAVGPIDGIVFDNVMSLAPGVQKDEETWAGCMPLVEQLSRKGIAQLWGDHTGWTSGRQYGTSTKSWRFDSVVNMTPLSEGEQPVDHLAFKMSFDHPGKARRRTPENWQDFGTQIVRLVDDRWSAEPAATTGPKPAPDQKLSHKNAIVLREVRKAISVHGCPHQPEDDTPECLAVTRSTVRERLIAAGFYPDHQLCPALRGEASQVSPTRTGLTTESNALMTLKNKGIIGYNRLLVWLP
jgi:hypothetical protein